MAFNFNYDPTQYEEKDFSILPEGDYRVRISNVAEKVFSTGNPGFEITLDVSGKNSHLWFYLVINAADPKQTNQRIGAFYDSFGIPHTTQLNAYKTWIGKVGAVRVKHDTYNNNLSAKVAFCIARKNQDRLPAWVDPAGTTTTATANFEEIKVNEDDLPF